MAYSKMININYEGGLMEKNAIEKKDIKTEKPPLNDELSEGDLNKIDGGVMEGGCIKYPKIFEKTIVK
jgi:hypothetical protein